MMKAILLKRKGVPAVVNRFQSRRWKPVWRTATLSTGQFKKHVLLFCTKSLRLSHLEIPLLTSFPAQKK